jgi:hypothetical protein
LQLCVARHNRTARCASAGAAISARAAGSAVTSRNSIALELAVEDANVASHACNDAARRRATTAAEAEGKVPAITTYRCVPDEQTVSQVDIP